VCVFGACVCAFGCVCECGVGCVGRLFDLSVCVWKACVLGGCWVCVGCMGTNRESRCVCVRAVALALCV